MENSSKKPIASVTAFRDGADAQRRVLIIDDHSFFSFCLRTLIDREEDLRVCDVAAEEEDLPDRIGRFRPDVLVIDLSVGRQGGLDLARGLREAAVTTPILFVSAAHAVPAAQLASIAGAAFASKGGQPRELIRQIKALMAAPATPLALDPQRLAVA